MTEFLSNEALWRGSNVNPRFTNCFSTCSLIALKSPISGNIETGGNPSCLRNLANGEFNPPSSAYQEDDQYPYADKTMMQDNSLERFSYHTVSYYFWGCSFLRKMGYRIWLFLRWLQFSFCHWIICNRRCYPIIGLTTKRVMHISL